jgi:hypothetical protein
MGFKNHTTWFVAGDKITEWGVNRGVFPSARFWQTIDYRIVLPSSVSFKLLFSSLASEL